MKEVLLSNPDIVFRVLFVDDGSTDRSWEMIESICARSPHFSALRLSRNFGAHVAITAGIDHADGDAVVTLACDLQDPPETVLEFIERWRRGARIVWGTRRSRAESRGRILVNKVFSFLLRRYAMPDGSKFVTGSFLLLDRTVVAAFRRFGERNRITFALVAWTGFEQDVVLYDRRARTVGVSGWTLAKTLKAVYDTFIGFSVLPARLITLLGMMTFGLSIAAVIYLVIAYLVGNVLPGWTGVMVTMTLMFGLLFMMIGLMGEYMHRIFIETTNRPLYFVSQMAGVEDDSRRDT